MIAITYLWVPDREFEMELFETKEEAKQWLITELVDHRYIYSWYDDKEDKYYESRYDIRECLEKCTLEEIIECSILPGELEIIIKEK